MHAFLPSMLPWRSSAALALRRLGRRDRALELLDHELELASAAGVERAVSRALRIRGLVEGGPAGTESLRRAVSVLDGVGPRLERTAGLVELGAALRRSGLRREAREPLHAAFAAAVEGGATALAERARAELAAAGSRPRRPVLTGADALTSSERRVARMAAEGMTNREIAETLFVTIKTVEWHLRHTFRKLEVDGRRQLAAALEGAGL
jgi:DNA-binding CsgD family transcriptional regulator